jgi:hypothetical protein
MAFADWVKNDLDFGDLITGSFKIIKLRLSHFLLIFLFVELVGNLISNYFTGKTAEWDNYTAIALSFATTFLFSNLSGIMLTMLVGGFASGKSISFAEMVAKGFRILPIVLLTSLMAGFLVLFGTMLLIIPGVAVAVYLGFYLNAIVLRDKGPLEALEYSYKLVKGRWWMVFGVLLLVFVAVFVLVFLFQLLSKSISTTILSVVIQSLISCYVYVLMCIFFFNLEARQNN